MDKLHNFQMNSSDMLFNIEGSPYEKQKKIGSGTYGIVYSAIDQRTGQHVAVKKVCNVFDNLMVARRTYREIKILRHFQHDNVICIRDILPPKEKLFSDIYLVFDLMDTDLHRVIHSRQEITDEHVRYFLYQILRGLKYIHSASVIHRDLKPGNILLNENCDLKIGDFGMARVVSRQNGADCTNNELLMTLYVMTRWYRAPELMLFRRQYTVDVDMWSVGCIFAEMLARRAVFPGKGLFHQLTLLVNTLGPPDTDFVSLAHADRIKDFLFQLKPTQAVPLNTLLPNAHPKSLRLLQKMLRWNPSERISVESALKDLYLNSYHNPTDEPVCTKRLDFTFDEDKTSDINELRRVVADEIHDMLSVTSSTALSDASLPAPQNTPSVTLNAVTDIRQASVVEQLHPSTAMDCHGQQSSSEHKIAQKSHPAVRDQGTSCLSTSSRSRISHKGANFSRRTTTQISNGRQKTASVAERMTSAHGVILPAAASRSLHGNVTAISSTVDAKAKLRALILSGSRQQQPKNVKVGRCRHADNQRQNASNANTTLSTMVRLTDEDKVLLERWQRMQQQHGVSSVVSAAGAEGNEVVTTSNVASVTTVNSGGLQLCSADSRLADQCLADLDLVWSPSVVISSGDISKCLQASTASSQTTEAADAVAIGDSYCTMDTLQQCCAGYGVGEIIPSMINNNCEPMQTEDDGLLALLSEELLQTVQ